MKFKVGDRVKIVNNVNDQCFDKYVGSYATILKCTIGMRNEAAYILNIGSALGTVWYDAELILANRLPKLKRILNESWR